MNERDVCPRKAKCSRRRWHCNGVHNLRSIPVVRVGYLHGECWLLVAHVDIVVIIVQAFVECLDWRSRASVYNWQVFIE